MGQAEGPETQVGGSVGDADQRVLYGVDGLINKHVPHTHLQGPTQSLQKSPNMSSTLL